MPFEHYKDIVEFGKWAEIERRYGRCELNANFLLPA
jgi:hypothetical protein